ARPYFSSEPRLRAAGETRDLRGHVHKTHFLGSYRREIDHNLESIFQGFRKLHDKVYSVASKAQIRRDILRAAIGLRSLGATLPADRENVVDAPEEFTPSGAAAYSSPQAYTNELLSNPLAFRMLEFAYRYHAAVANHNTPRDRVPVIIPGYARRYSTVIEHPFALDPYDLIIYTQGSQVRLPENSDGTGAEERNIWKRIIHD
ncbi:MAG: hypothetical protein DCC75_13515, partial [Proteobacteria bacterium]